MKKYIVYFFSLALITTSQHVHAQQGFSVSVKGMPQFSMLNNKDDNNNSNYSSKATLNGSFGVGVAYNFTANLGIGVDGLYSLQGQRYKLSGTEFNQKNDYVKIPLYFSYNTDPSKKIAFIGKLGPQLSILTNSKLTDKNGNTIDGNTKDQYKSTSFGGMVSAGAQYRLSKTLYLTTAWRFDYDFTNAEDNGYKNDNNGRATTHNMTSGLEVGLKYSLGN